MEKIRVNVRQLLIPGIHGGRQLVPIWHSVKFAQKFHMPAVQMRVQAGFVLRSVRAEWTVELGFHPAFVLQMPRQTGVVIVHLAAILARIGDFLAVEVSHRSWLCKIVNTEEFDIRKTIGTRDYRNYEDFVVKAWRHFFIFFFRV